MKKILIYLFTVLLTSVPAMAQTEPVIPDADPVIEDIIRSYSPWYSVEFNGKVRNDRLPLSPTVRMFMIRDSLIQISLRAPLLGEVARIDIDGNRLLIVNKMKKTYVQESLSSLIKDYPAVIEDVQNIFLARVTILGSGQLDFDNCAAVSLSEDNDGNWIVIPDSDIPDGFGYGYVIGPRSRTLASDFIFGDKLEADISYYYANSGMQMDVNARSKGKNFEVVFDFSSVKWGGTPMAAINLSSYTRMGISEFVKSF